MTTLQDLGLAFRKAKVDLYYSSHASLEAIADYEENLHANLSALLIKITSADESWVTQPESSVADLGRQAVDMSCWKQYRLLERQWPDFSFPCGRMGARL